MSLLRRAPSRLFPVFSAVPVATLPTLAESRALAVLLVVQGRRVNIRPAEHGFIVSEVQA